MNSSIREIPVTISAFSMGMLTRPSQIVRFLRFMEFRAMAAIDQHRGDQRGKCRDDQCVVQGGHNLAVVKQLHVPFEGESPHFARVLDALKERTISVAMGA